MFKTQQYFIIILFFVKKINVNNYKFLLIIRKLTI